MIDPLQQTLAVLVVLGLLAATLWWLRRKGMARFGGGLRRGPQRRMQQLERLPLTAQHSLCLVRAADRVLLVSLSPGGCTLLEKWPAGEWEAQNPGPAAEAAR